MDINDSHIDVAGHRLHIQQLDPGHDGSPLVFLHEGLGSIELWRDFPARVAAETGAPGLVYSRHGHGWSDSLAGPREPDYMHREAHDTLPVIVDAFLARPPVLIGHSDGASISIIHAGAGHTVAGLVLLAPHVFVEEEGLTNIADLHSSFPGSELAEKMTKYHADPEATFRGWAEIWLSPAFRRWNIEEYLGGIRCPVLLIQCEDDEYGSVGQLDAIASQVQGTVERLILPGAGHSPHLAHPDAVISATARFVETIGPLA